MPAPYHYLPKIPTASWWFVDFDPVRAKSEGRNPGLPKHLADLFPDSFEDSARGRFQRRWEVGMLGELVEHLRDNEIPLDYPDVVFRHFSIPALRRPIACVGVWANIKGEISALHSRLAFGYG